MSFAETEHAGALQSNVQFIDSSVAAGFPAPSDDNASQPLNIQDLLVKRPQATFLLRVAGESLHDMGIFDGDLVVVDRSCAPKARVGHLVIAVVDTEFTTKMLAQDRQGFYLRPANTDYPDIHPREGESLTIWGVVTSSVKIAPGFTAPSYDNAAQPLNIQDLLVKRPQATFLLRISGESLRDMGIFDGDLVVVDRSLAPKARVGHLVIAVVDTEFTIKLLGQDRQGFYLRPANADYPDIHPREGESLSIWGVVTSSVKIYVP